MESSDSYQFLFELHLFDVETEKSWIWFSSGIRGAQPHAIECCLSFCIQLSCV